jgi:transposase InsO family protein
MAVRQQRKHELAAALQGRYVKAGRKEKGQILDEFVAATGYHRKWAVGLLRQGPPVARRGQGGRPRVYSAGVVGTLRQVWQASGERCGQRLAPLMEELVPALEAEGTLTVAAPVREQLLQMSAATMDRRRRPFRLQPRRGLGTTKPGTLLKRQIPVQTETPWDEQRRGFVELDLVAHGGTTTAGHYVNTLTVTDVATGWTEWAAVWGKGQAAVCGALEQLRDRLPFPLLGIDSDNGSEFLNAHLVRWCAQEQLTFTRSRPYWKNDQAPVEQKNGSVVRRRLGYDRYETEAERALLQRVYAGLRLWTNHWQPVLKLIGKERVGTKVRKQYDPAQTPYRRVLACDEFAAEARARLEHEHAAHGPTVIWKEVEAARAALWRLPSRRAPQPSWEQACG